MDKIRIKLTLALGALLLLGMKPLISVPEDILPVTVKTELDRPLIHQCEGEQKVVIKIEVKGAEVAPGDRMPLNLAIVLDRSGSMSGVSSSIIWRMAREAST